MEDTSLCNKDLHTISPFTIKKNTNVVMKNVTLSTGPWPTHGMMNSRKLRLGILLEPSWWILGPMVIKENFTRNACFGVVEVSQNSPILRWPKLWGAQSLAKFPYKFPYDTVSFSTTLPFEVDCFPLCVGGAMQALHSNLRSWQAGGLVTTMLNLSLSYYRTATSPNHLSAFSISLPCRTLFLSPVPC